MSTKSWHLNRRTFLMGAGASLGLPYLNCMGSETPAALPNRLCCVYFPYGIADLSEDSPNADYGWWPIGQGKNFRYNRTNKPLEAFRDEVTFFKGFDHARVKVGGHQSADFFLTGADTRSNNNSVSLDQVAAAHLGAKTRMSSLVLSSDGGVGSPGMSHTLSFNPAGRALPGLANPVEIYEKLFGSDSPAVRRQLEVDRSALDLLLESAHSLDRRLGQEDRRTMDQFLSSVRTLEQDVQRSQTWLQAARSAVDRNDLQLRARVDDGSPQVYLRTVYDLIYHGFRTDNTRVATFQTASMRNQLSNASRWPRFLGLGGDCHSLAHGAQNNFTNKSRWDSFMLEQFAHLVKRLKDTREGDAQLLDRTLLFYGSSNSRTHNNKNYPLILVGGKKMGFQHGQYLKNNQSKPLADIYLTMLQGLGIPTRSFADSTGPLAALRSA